MPLNSYLHYLFDKGLKGFRPINITKATDDNGRECFLVHFSIHDVPRTSSGPTEIIEAPDDTSIDEIMAGHAEYESIKANLSEYHVITGQKISEGDRFSIRHEKYEQASNMFAMLQFRWAVSVIQCLVGAAGLSEDEYDEPGPNRYWGPLI